MRKYAMGIALVVIAAGCATTAPTEAASTAEGSVSAAPAAPPEFKDLPVEALTAFAMEVEKQVAEGNREPALTSVGGLVVETPSIRQAARTRAARVELVRAFLDSGHAWERRNGRLWVLRTPEYKKAGSSDQKDIDAIMVNGENRDRWALYEGLIDANKLGRGALAPIEEIFFEARVKHMTVGQKFEAEDGQPAAIAP